MKLDTCIIVKNEENNIEALIKQLLIFSNEIHITDTGSTDKTLDIIKKLQKDHQNLFLHHFEWIMDFSAARNYSLTCYNCKADYQFWCDADDLLNDTLIDTMKKFISEDNLNDDIYYIKYKYYKTNEKTHNRTSILKVSCKFKWKDPIHEYVETFTNNKKNFDYFGNGSLLIHNSSGTYNHAQRNLEIFMNMEKNGYKFSTRNLFYYGRELYNAKLWEYSKFVFKKCINTNSTDKIHCINSAIKLFQLRDEEAFEYANKLFKRGIYRKDLIYRIGEYFFLNKNYELARLYLNMSIDCKIPNENDIMSVFYDHSCHNLALDKLHDIENNIK